MPRVVLGVTGSVAAIRAAELVAALRRRGHEVRVVLIETAAYFVAPEAQRLSSMWSTGSPRR